jgi:hypothetical protein
MDCNDRCPRRQLRCSRHDHLSGIVSLLRSRTGDPRLPLSGNVQNSLIFSPFWSVIFLNSSTFHRHADFVLSKLSASSQLPDYLSLAMAGPIHGFYLFRVSSPFRFISASNRLTSVKTNWPLSLPESGLDWRQRDTCSSLLFMYLQMRFPERE